MINNNFSILFSHYGIYNRGGFGRSFPLAKGLIKLGHKVTFLTVQDKTFKFPYKIITKENLKIVAFPEVFPKVLVEKGFGFLSIILKFIYIVAKKYDILHSDSGHRPNSGIPIKLYKLFHKKAIYISEWWDYFGKGGQFDDRPFLSKYSLGVFDLVAEIKNKKRADGVVALSSYTKRRAIKNGIKKGRIKVIHGGADVNKISYFKDNTHLKKKYGFNKDSLIFGFIGMVGTEYLDIIPFLEAMTLIKSNHQIEWFTTGGILNDSIKKEYSIGNELKEFGWLSYETYSEVISCADVFLLLQRENAKNEARWPNKLGDYLAAGRVILTNPFGEIAYLCNNYPDSFIKTKWDTNHVKNDLINLYENKDSLLELGYHNRLVAKNEYSWDLKAKELNEFYLEILNNKSTI